MSVPTNNPQLSGYPGAHNPQGASPYQGATPYQGSAQQGASPYQGATPYQGSAQQGASPYPGGLPQSYPGSAPQPYGGAQTQASTKKIPTAFILGIAVRDRRYSDVWIPGRRPAPRPLRPDHRRIGE